VILDNATTATDTAMRPARIPSDASKALRRLADLLDAGLAQHRLDPTSGALLDAEVGGLRCILIPVPSLQHALSPREAQIARMVSRGLTNRAIASALEISLWTVSTHLRRIFAKLDVNSRAEMVALVCLAPTSPQPRSRR
jgi:DNA-binding CsgD family transcriptional regulator